MKYAWFAVGVIYIAAAMVAVAEKRWSILLFDAYGAISSYLLFRLLDERARFWPDVHRLIETQVALEAHLNRLEQERIDRTVEQLLGREE